jgi:hypothetical protein
VRKEQHRATFYQLNSNFFDFRFLLFHKQKMQIPVELQEQNLPPFNEKENQEIAILMSITLRCLGNHTIPFELNCFSSSSYLYHRTQYNQRSCDAVAQKLELAGYVVTQRVEEEEEVSRLLGRRYYKFRYMTVDRPKISNAASLPTGSIPPPCYLDPNAEQK